jgi:hypothetical protein
MKLRTKAVWSLAVACCMALLLASPAAAQTITTGNITGHDQRRPGRRSSWCDRHGAAYDTGTSYEAVTGTDGRFTILNVRVGTYTVRREHERLQGSEAGEGGRRARRREDGRLQAAAGVRQ